MKRLSFIFVLLVGCSMLFQFCTAGRSAGASSAEPDRAVVSYSRDVAPIILDRCAPCHFPGEGKKQPLHTRSAVSLNIEEMLARVERSPEEEGFMPFKSKKEPLSDSLILVLRTWKENGMTE